MPTKSAPVALFMIAAFFLVATARLLGAPPLPATTEPGEQVRQLLLPGMEPVDRPEQYIKMGIPMSSYGRVVRFLGTMEEGGNRRAVVEDTTSGKQLEVPKP